MASTLDTPLRHSSLLLYRTCCWTWVGEARHMLDYWTLVKHLIRCLTEDFSPSSIIMASDVHSFSDHLSPEGTHWWWGFRLHSSKVWSTTMDGTRPTAFPHFHKWPSRLGSIQCEVIHWWCCAIQKDQHHWGLCDASEISRQTPWVGRRVADGFPPKEMQGV